MQPDYSADKILRCVFCFLVKAVMLSTPLDADRAVSPAVGWPHNAKPCIRGIFLSPTFLTASLNYDLPDDFMRKICESWFFFQCSIYSYIFQTTLQIWFFAFLGGKNIVRVILVFGYITWVNAVFSLSKEPTPAPVSPPAEKVSTKGKNNVLTFFTQKLLLKPLLSKALIVCKPLFLIPIICAYRNTLFMT